MVESTKIWSIKGRNVFFMGKPFSISPPSDSNIGAPTFNTALINAIKGEALPKSVSKDDLKNALRHSLKISHQLIPPTINTLNIDALPDYKPKQKTKSPKPAGLRKLMAQAAKPLPEYDPKAHYESIGNWEYRPADNALFYDKKAVKGDDFAIRGYGILIEKYPLPIHMSDLIDELHQEKYDFNDASLIKRLQEVAAFVKAFPDGTLEQSPLHRIYHKSSTDPSRDLMVLKIDPLSLITPSLQDTMGLARYCGNNDVITVSSQQQLVWLNDKLSDTFKSASGIELLAHFIKRKGQLVTGQELRREGLNPSANIIKTLSEKLAQALPHSPNIGIHIEDSEAYVFYDSRQEMLRAVASADGANAKALTRIGAIGAIGKDDRTVFAPQIL